ncbi:T9SS type A sorting domain-containing protein [Pontibacter sp. G13]|uniref:T9SS type A sorting domain-containing protein n=1 Tax=Pontibacter sp. G13 TaxID=3074898 RepID=UPI00288B813C|nr:T9SS type A sorting domain-containing protein [Pontibacter sp. G13]WNJ17111.1 T9SS type A sorting domain-containing protein [Pontibacter sp. G13]
MNNCYPTRIWALTALCLISAFQAFAQPTAPAGQVWEEVPELSDEFDTFDNSKWYKSLWNYGVPVQMTTQNSGVDDGKLWIKATLDTSSTRWFNTSRIWSKSQISYPMYTECSMKTAHISAYNTFWMNNGDINNRDEIDICENNSKPTITSYTDWPYLMQSQYFLTVNTQDERAKGNFDNRNLSANNPLKGVKWNEAYHTLGVWWKDKNNVQFYLDGEPAGSVTTTRDFTRSLNIIWDLWTIDAQWSGGIANQQDLLNDSINTMRVDWIHTYRLVSDGSVSIDDEVSQEAATLYPNPATDVIQVQLLTPAMPGATAQIFDQQGKLVQEANLFETTSTIQLEQLPASLYLVKVQNGDQMTYQKVIKR